jgi:hypothetical protein
METKALLNAVDKPDEVNTKNEIFRGADCFMSESITRTAGWMVQDSGCVQLQG